MVAFPAHHIRTHALVLFVIKGFIFIPLGLMIFVLDVLKLFHVCASRTRFNIS